MSKDYVAVLLGGNYYGLPKYDHLHCAHHANQGHYVTQHQVEKEKGPLNTVVCYVCQQSLVSKSQDDPTTTRTSLF